MGPIELSWGVLVPSWAVLEPSHGRLGNINFKDCRNAKHIHDSIMCASSGVRWAILWDVLGPLWNLGDVLEPL